MLRRSMQKFIRNTKGAVTVFITLLLIPAMLISGTAVDLVRIHTARSTIQNANQLAANTMLTQYNALLYDIYGIMGIAKDDPILWRLLDDYIKVTVFGEEFQDRSIGTLQVFYGANLTLEEPYFPEGKNLRSEEVLRRQIEEYMQFRGPALLVMGFIDRLTENRIVEDAQAIHQKMEIDSAIADLHEKYKELYEAIVAADQIRQVIRGIAGGSFGYVSSVLTYIWEEFEHLARLSRNWIATDCPAVRAGIEARYRTVMNNVRSLVIGGPRVGFWADGNWGRVGNINVGLNQAIENAKQQADDFKPRFDTVVEIAKELDAMKDELSRKVDDFEIKLNSSDLSEELRDALTKRHGSPPTSIIERYRGLLKWEIEPMATVYRDGGYSYIDDIHKPMLDEVRYRNRYNEHGLSISRDELESIRGDSRFNIGGDFAGRLTAFPRSNVTYRMSPDFIRFADYPGDNAEFFAQLDLMMNQPSLPPIHLFDEQREAEGRNAEEQQRNLINELLMLASAAYNGLRNDPLGAKYIGSDFTAVPPETNILEIIELIPEALEMPVLGIIRDPLGSLENLADYILLLTYSTSMFSNYATSKPGSIGKTLQEHTAADFERTISGVPMSPEVNYFYQSEWEYLYYGRENAVANLSAITRLLLLVRIVCNYIRVFSVTEITTIVTSIKATFSWAPPLAIILGELARAAFVAAESVIDVAALRSGHRVALFKNVAAGEWISTPSGVLNAAVNVISSESVDGVRFQNDKGLSYSNYMLFFFLTRALFYTGSDGDAANELAIRTGNLIEWNIVNYQSRSNADEAMMAAALNQQNRFRLEDMKTDFSLTTTADLRMLFFSMAFAQNFSDSRGIGMPRSMPVHVTDYRGY